MFFWSVLRQHLGIKTSPRSLESSEDKSWAVSGQKGKKSKIGLDIPLQGHNLFVNGFVERPQGVHRYLNEPKIT